MWLQSQVCRILEGRLYAGNNRISDYCPNCLGGSASPHYPDTGSECFGRLARVVRLDTGWAVEQWPNVLAPCLGSWLNSSPACVDVCLKHTRHLPCQLSRCATLLPSKLGSLSTAL